MTWQELKEEAKKMGAEIMVDYRGVEFIRFRGVCFRKDGAIDSGFKYGDIAINRKTDQMLAIMKALQ